MTHSTTNEPLITTANKRCTKCGLEKPVGSFPVRTRNGTTAVQSQCKACVCQKKREYHEAHKHDPQYRDKRRQACLRYVHSERGRERHREWKKTERGRQCNQRWRRSSKCRSYQKQYGIDHRDEIRTRDHARYLCHREHKREYVREYKQTPKGREMVRNNWHRRRQAIKAHTHQMRTKTWIAILECFEYRCAYCGQPLGDNVTVDHVVPLSRGGVHMPGNCVPCCAQCNSCKSAHTPEEVGYTIHYPVVFE